MKCDNGNILVGGDYKQLMIFDSHLKYIKSIDIQSYTYEGIAVGNYLFCWITGKISVID